MKRLNRLKPQIILILFSVLSPSINLSAQTDVINFADIMHLISVCPQRDVNQCLDSKLKVLNYSYERTTTDSEDESLIMIRYKHKSNDDLITYNQFKNLNSKKCCSVGFMTWNFSAYQSLLRELDGQGFINVGNYQKNSYTIQREYRLGSSKMELILVENNKWGRTAYTFLFSFY